MALFVTTIGVLRLVPKSWNGTRVRLPPTTIAQIDVHDVRFPTSRERDGSDAMSPDPDYSAAYVDWKPLTMEQAETGGGFVARLPAVPPSTIASVLVLETSVRGAQ